MATILTAGAGILGLACSEQARRLVGPGTIGPPNQSAGQAWNQGTGGTHGQPLTAVVGAGTGVVNISPEASTEGFSVEVQVSVRNTQPDTTFLLTRAVDFVPDGVCTGGAFTPLPLPHAGALETLTTSAGGAGATHASFSFAPLLPVPPPFEDGMRFDVHWEIRTEDFSIVLRSGCFTVTVK